MTTPRRVRIGIDVGGTFTHAAAIDAATLELVGKAKTPTTHAAADGVARGVVDALLALMAGCAIAPGDIVLIAHSTTQATNALLEGDVSPVGIVGMGRGAGGLLARRQTAIRPIVLAPGRVLKTSHRFVSSERASDAALGAAIRELRDAGAAVIVAAEAFSVDDPQNEERVCALAAELGLPATATHHVSRLHGLGVRTRTAVINASMIPRMLATADMTERAVRQAGIAAPLMIMRSDGGVMDIAEMRRRPILTMLSGPAAGVAAALLYARVSDGVFLEVGGTSTDISVIRNGRCQIRSAEVGGQKLHLSTLDVRTIGVAGGSLVRRDADGAIGAVGPRSAHIAGAPYLSFAEARPAALAAGEFEFDGASYLGVLGDEESRFVVTPTCASNLLGLVPEGDPAHGKLDAIRAGLSAICGASGRWSDAAQLASAVLDRAAERVVPLIEGLIRDYRLDRGVIRLIGGGGGASAIVPFVARRMGLAHETAPSADVISAIGVALALVRDAVERTAIDPSDEDIRRIREEALQCVLRMGAAPDTIQVFVEVDSRRNLLRATAEGSTEIRRQELRRGEASLAERRELVSASIGASVAAPALLFAAGGFEVWSAERDVPRLWRFLPERRRAVRALDAAGAIRWASNHSDAAATTVAAAERDLAALAKRYTRYSDAGATIPKCFALLDGRIVDLSGLVDMHQVLEVLRIELARHGGDVPCGLLVER